MNVLSLFDGMSCAMIALNKLNIKPENYFASEIDKYAIQVSKANWPEIKHIGDVTKVCYFEGVLYTEFGNYEASFEKGLICGGSPCQGFSFAGKQLNFEDTRSKLFFEFVRIWKEIKVEHPDVKVFLENVLMKKEYQLVISKALGFDCVMVNSSLVSAQNRKRLYWTNIPFQGQPEDRGILLKHILEYEVDSKYALSQQGLERGLTKKYSLPKFDPDKTGTLNTKNNSGQLSIDSGTTFISVEEGGKGYVLNRGEHQERNEKAMCLDANYWKGADNHGQRADNHGQRADNHGQRTVIQVGLASDINGHDYNKRIYSAEGKSPTLNAHSGGNLEPKIALTEKEIIRAKEKYSGKVWKSGNRMGNMQFPDSTDKKSKSLCATQITGSRETIHIENNFIYRKLTVTECERLQCVPDGYTHHVSNTQAYKMLGNGWNVDTIVHLFEPLLWLDIL